MTAPKSDDPKSGPTTKIAIAATFTADPVVVSVSGMLRLFGLASAVELADYDQLPQELIGRSGAFAKNAGGVNVALVRLADLGARGARRESAPVTMGPQAAPNPGAPGAPDLDVVRTRAAELSAQLAGFAQREDAPPLLLCICPEPQRLVNDASSSYRASVAAIEATLAAEARAAGAEVVTSADLALLYPVDRRDDPESDELGHIPYTAEMFAAIGAAIARKIRARAALPFKVLALDADNTLWTGILGEDGPDGVVIDEGRAAIQRFALAQRERGMLLCISSKNASDDVEELFRKRPMPLARGHLAGMRVNWQPKSANLRSLAAELSVGLDAFVFVDDSFVECAEVRSRAPEVLTIQLPADSAAAASLLHHVWAFDRWGVTDDDEKRAERYATNAAREKLRREAPSLSEFLASLELAITIEPPEPADMPRVSQLTTRTNQMNFTTVRRSEAEIRRSELSCLKVHVRDRFGDHGLVGVMLHGERDGALVVDTFLLSCRVLHRGVEHRMMARLGEIAKERGLSHVEATIVRTAKNQPAEDVLRSMGEPWLEARADGFVVRFPAEAAAALTYEPDTAPKALASEALQDEPKPPPAPKAGAVAQTVSIAERAAMERIAREFRTAAAILEHVSPRGASRARPALRAIVAPRTEEERAIAAICEEALGVAPVGLTDDLFLDLGADSFAAVRIAAAMRTRLGRRVDVVTVQEARTVERLAAPARAPVTAGRTPPIHALRREGRKRPLFLARPATRSGGALSYAALARHLDPDRPVYVFQNRPLLDSATPYQNVEEMAAEYLAAMREVDPTGPYLLGGWCLGGKTAFEMANQLVTVGERVAGLVLFDTLAPNGLREQVEVLGKRALTRLELLAFARAPWLTRVLPKVKVARSRSMMARFAVLAYFAPDDDDVRLIEYAFPGRFDGAALRAMEPGAMWQHVYAALKAAEPAVGEGDGIDAAAVRRGYKYFAWDHYVDAIYAPAWVYPGEVLMLTVRGAAIAPGWERLLARPPIVSEFDVKGTAEAPDPHNAMMSNDNVALWAGELNRRLGDR